jgi:type I restriction enzyme, S subunit
MDTCIGFGSTEFHVLRAKKNLLPEYLYYIVNTNSFFQMGEALMTGSAGQKRVPTSFVANYVLTLPPLVEQTAIVTHIETQSAKIDQAISLQQQQIGKLKEYKATLINSAVTGKILVN